MQLRYLSLENMRSYEKLELNFSEPLRQVFIGPNGGGKTNLIEALSFLSMGRSCLKSLPEDVLRWGRDFFRITAEINSDAGGKTLEYVWQKSPRRQSAVFINDVKVPLLKFIGVLKTVVFLPEHLDLFTGSPQLRRNFIDLLLSQTGEAYAALRIEYERILKQRNALLKRILENLAKRTELELWDQQLSGAAKDIQLRRMTIVDEFNRELGAAFESLGEDATGASMVYERKTSKTEPEALRQEFLRLLSESQDRDLALATTTVGPHRDDWFIARRGHDLRKFASRGQQRAALISLLLLGARVLERATKEKPVIMLDDVFSELDESHQKALLTSLSENQVLITSTHGVPIKGDVMEWNVGDGKIGGRIKNN